MYIFCDSIQQSFCLSFLLGYCLINFVMTSMKSFSFMVTSFRFCFIELKIKKGYSSLCLLRKGNKTISEWWYFSNFFSVLLYHLTLPLSMYCDNYTWNEGAGFCGLLGFYFHDPFHNIAFQRQIIKACVYILWIHIPYIKRFFKHFLDQTQKNDYIDSYKPN